MSASPQTEQKVMEAINESLPINNPRVGDTFPDHVSPSNAPAYCGESSISNQDQNPENNLSEPNSPMSIDGEEEKMRKLLEPDEKSRLLKAIAGLSTDDVNAVTRAADEVLPEDVALDSKHLSAAVHPDRFQDEKEKQLAHVAFKRLHAALKHHGGNANFYFGGKKPKQHVEGALSDYHHIAHSESTQYLRILCEALLRKTFDSSEVTKAKNKLNKINESIKSQNESNNVDEDLGKIRYDLLLGQWRVAISEPQQQEDVTEKIAHLCHQVHYPPEWAELYRNCLQHIHDSSNPKDNPQGSNQFSQDGGNVQGTSDPKNSPQGINPQRSNQFPQDGGNVQGTSDPKNNPQGSSHFPQYGINAYQNHSKTTAGGKKVIALAPQKVQRTIQNGYTSTGEKILFIQELGQNRARFVVEMHDATRQLVESAAAGGQLALEGAREARVPETTRRESDILHLRAEVKKANTYGITFMAVGAWDVSKKRLPFIVVGFFHTIGTITKENAVARSGLGKIIGSKEAERMMVEAMEFDRELSLREALEFQISPLNHESKPRQPEIIDQPRISWERQEPAWFQKPKTQFKHSIPQQSEFSQQQPQPFYQQGPQQPFYQQGLQQPFYQQGPQQPSYQQGLQQPFYQQGLQEPSYQQGPQEPSYQQGLQQPSYQQGPQQPFYQQGPQQPFYQQGLQQPVFT